MLAKNAAAWDFLRGNRITMFAPQVTIDAVIVFYCEEFPRLKPAALHSKIVRCFWPDFCGQWEIEVYCEFYALTIAIALEFFHF